VNGEGATESDPSVRPPLDTRQRLVDAAVELVFEHYSARIKIRDAYDYLTPKAVADRAGVSRGMIYHFWGGADDDEGSAVERFLEEVAGSICRRTAGAAEYPDVAELFPDNLSDLLVALCEYEMQRICGDGRETLQATQAMTLHDQWPPGEADRVRATTITFHERLAEKLGREAVPPLTLTDFASAVAAVIEGFGLMTLLHPADYDQSYEWAGREGPPELVHDTWNLMAITIEGLVLNMTRPIASEEARPQK
jgi:AcrR family transcriptional regulator